MKPLVREYTDKMKKRKKIIINYQKKLKLYIKLTKKTLKPLNW